MANNQSLISVSATAVAAGIFVSIFSATYGAAMIAAGVCGILANINIGENFEQLWKNLGLCKDNVVPLLKETRRNECSTVYRFTLPYGLSSECFERNKLAIEQFLNKSVEISYSNRNIIIEAFNEELPKLVEFRELSVPGSVAFPVGVDKHGKFISVDLSKNEPHCIVAGETGSGKSVTLRSIITYLLLYKDVDLHLIDYKMGAEFRVFERCKKVISFAKTTAEADAILNKLSKEVDRRYNLFAKHDCVDIKDYNKKHKPLRYQVLVIDEFAEMSEEKGGIKRIQMLSAKARAAGIHCILSTQRPSADVINGRIKANCATVVGLKTMNELNSRIVIDHSGLEELRGNGHGIVKHDGKESEVQCMYLDVEQAKEMVKHLYKEDLPKQQTDVVDFTCLDVICK